MARYDIYNILNRSGTALKGLTAYNPLTIRKRSTRTKAIFALGIVCFFWGTTWVASKEGVKHMPAIQLVGIRQFLAGACYVLFYIIKGARWPRRGEWVVILVLSCLNFLFSNNLSTWAMKYIPAGLGSIIGAVFPLWMVVIGLFTSAAAMPRKAIIGLLLGFGGICIIFFEHLDELFIGEFRFGIFLALFSTLTWALGTLYTKKHAANFNPYFSLGLQMLISGSVLMGFTEVTGEAMPLLEIPWQSWVAILYLVSFGSIVTFMAYLYALQRLSAEQTSIYAYINPLVAVLLGSMMFDEKLTLFIAVGGTVALYGVFLVNKAYRIK